MDSASSASAHHARRAAGSIRSAATCSPPAGAVRAVGGGRGPAQQRPQAGEQLVELEGLGEVVVGARVQPGDAVGRLDARGEHEDGGAVALGAQHAAHRQAVDVGHHHVDHQRVEAVAPDAGQRLDPVHGRGDVVALQLERPREGLADRAVVVGDEDPALVGGTDAVGR